MRETTGRNAPRVAEILGFAKANGVEAIVWILLAGLTFGSCYVAWCKAFRLIGVGPGVPGFLL
jgi:hypothetical protein